ncbi:MAG: beta-hydroxyacyl-ACP dehydratase, partial [Planctomycetes bacterium]|nr:beta-hydroxyacyl-ACP dehydratase [Planctomycetota bacterium]
WIDKFVEFENGKRAVALKNVTMAEEHIHDHFPHFPIMPETLMIEAMAQTAGILVSKVNDFEEKVILAKIKNATFNHYVAPGDTILIEAEIESITDEAASTTGKITCGDKVIAQIDLMFSHIDQNLAGKEFPEENFVMTDLFEIVLRDLAMSGRAK